MDLRRLEMEDDKCDYLASVLDSLDEGIFTVDENMRIVTFNRTVQELTGYSSEEALGRPCHEVFKTEICSSTCPLRYAFDSGETVMNREIDIFDKRQRRIPISVSASVLRNADGEVVGGVETFRDLSTTHVLKKELKEKYSFRDLVSRNPVMRGLFDILPDVAESEATVLLNGDSGTGKELFTKAIHELSPRRDGPLVVVNCGALPEQLLEAEIFGVKRGAFTGATENRPGRLELAQGGTLFLDEIGDLPLALQVKLLRVLENKEYQPLGGRHMMKADVRFVTATHRDLEAMVDDGVFRRDLLFRINVLTLRIPPLRERTEDIPLLLDMALDRFNKRYGKSIRGYSPEAIRVLLRHDYPGNVRELLNIVEQMVILCRNGEIGADQLPAAFSRAGHGAEPPLIAPPKNQSPDPISYRIRPIGGALTSGCSRRSPLRSASAATCNEQALSELLERHHGSRSQVARELGVDRSTLWRWMKRLSLET